MKVILVAYATTWPILFNTVYGVHDVDPVAVQTARCFGLKHAAILWHINLPSAAPFIFTGIRISASIGLIVVIGAELACIRRQRHRLVHSVCVIQWRPDGFSPCRGQQSREFVGVDDQQCFGLDRSSLFRMAILRRTAPS